MTGPILFFGGPMDRQWVMADGGTVAVVEHIDEVTWEGPGAEPVAVRYSTYRRRRLAAGTATFDCMVHENYELGRVLDEANAVIWLCNLVAGNRQWPTR